ncbi:Galactosylgalactosylxylosylprotein 3-beta-glucuronosyltransferase 2 [Chamberlinius hualienensis]
MWPVRTRRGTRKRCAALFVVGLCAAIMIISRPFMTTPGGGNQLIETVASMAFISSNSSIGGLLRSNESVELNNNNTRNPSSSAAQQGALASTSDKNDLAPVSIVIKAEYLEEGKVVVADDVVVTDKSENDDVNVWTSTQPVPPLQTTGLSAGVTLMTSGPLVAAPTTEVVNKSSLKDNEEEKKKKQTIPMVYVLTPTFPRMEQMAELTRLGQTLMHISNLHWIVVDDAPTKSKDVENLLKRTGLPYTYSVAQMPEIYKKKKGSKPKGVANRLEGLKWIRDHGQDEGVMFFADDDNSYDIRLFEEMRWTKKVSMWPVGLVTQLGVSTPVVKDGHVIDFYDGWVSTRKFPVDMAGFAVNVGFLKSRQNVTMPYKAGFEEDGFLKSLNITIDQIEPKADNCTKIYVWHTKTVGNKIPQKISAKDRKRFKGSNLFSLPHIV